ncbi:unnamed protein product [Dibothriocephalus latus]|uniref:Uncharacterized protein n=1 Tax=Dibothriocephalus latus TaxID=60516 RepID=A0A3P7LFQ2_DIBLA|nr:unnamed protein product [Dibothriocephalus latus]
MMVRVAGNATALQEDSVVIWDAQNTVHSRTLEGEPLAPPWMAPSTVDVAARTATVVGAAADGGGRFGGDSAGNTTG